MYASHPLDGYSPSNPGLRISEVPLTRNAGGRQDPRPSNSRKPRPQTGQAQACHQSACNISIAHMTSSSGTDGAQPPHQRVSASLTAEASSGWNLAIAR